VLQEEEEQQKHQEKKRGERREVRYWDATLVFFYRIGGRTCSSVNRTLIHMWSYNPSDARIGWCSVSDWIIKFDWIRVEEDFETHTQYNGGDGNIVVTAAINNNNNNKIRRHE
jgi:hypothetical protein